MKSKIRNNEHYLIKPGTSIECAVKLDTVKEEIEIRSAMIYDASGDGIIMSQTTPKLLPSNVGKRIALTCLDSEKNIRMGLSATIERIIKDYKLASANAVQAVILTEMSDLQKFNLRFSFRVKPPEDSGLRLYTSRKELQEIVDISAGGVKFAHGALGKYEINQIIKLYVQLNSKLFEVKAQVLRIEPSMGIGLRKVEFIAVQFLDKSRELEGTLSRTVREIERNIRFRQMFA